MRKIIFICLFISVLFSNNFKTQKDGVSFFTKDPSFKAELSSNNLDYAIKFIKSVPIMLHDRSNGSNVKSVHIVSVSSYFGNENTISKTITNNVHNGSIIVKTLVFGYGGDDRDVLYYNGENVKQISSIGFDSNYDRVVDGWIDTWVINDVNGGFLTFKSKSINGNFKTTTLKLKG